MKQNKVNLGEKFSLFHEHWAPRIVGEQTGGQDSALLVDEQPWI